MTFMPTAGSSPLAAILALAGAGGATGGTAGGTGGLDLSALLNAPASPMSDPRTATALALLSSQPKFDPNVDPGVGGQISNAILPLIMAQIQGPAMAQQAQQEHALNQLKIVGALTELRKSGVEVDKMAMEMGLAQPLIDAIKQGQPLPQGAKLKAGMAEYAGPAHEKPADATKNLTLKTREILSLQGVDPASATPDQIRAARQQAIAEAPPSMGAAVSQLAGVLQGGQTEAVMAKQGLTANPSYDPSQPQSVDNMPYVPKVGMAEATKARETIRSAEQVNDSVNRLNTVITESPWAVGASGDVASTVQNAKAQYEQFAQYLGFQGTPTDPKAQKAVGGVDRENERVAAEARQLASSKGWGGEHKPRPDRGGSELDKTFTPAKWFDKNLPRYQYLVNTLAYQLARVRDPSGRLSDFDVQNAIDTITGGGRFNNARAIQSNLEIVRDEANMAMARNKTVLATVPRVKDPALTDPTTPLAAGSAGMMPKAEADAFWDSLPAGWSDQQKEEALNALLNSRGSR